jgi:hypothetical protein
VTASLILNSPYAAPSKYWQPGAGGALVETAGRRPASYEIFDIRNNTRRSEPLERVNEIRGRVDGWRAVGYPGATAMAGKFTGQRDFLALQLIRLVEQFLASDKLAIPSLFHKDEVRKRILIALNLDGIVQYLMRHVEQQNRDRLEPVFDEEQPIGSTRAMRLVHDQDLSSDAEVADQPHAGR